MGCCRSQPQVEVEDQAVKQPGQHPLDVKWEGFEVPRWEVDSSQWEMLGGRKIEQVLEHVDLVDLRFLIENTEAGRLLPRWQEVPHGARINASNVHRIKRCIGGVQVLSVLVLSLPWLDLGHPDNEGRLMRRLLPCLKVFMNAVDELGDERSTVGVMTEYACFPYKRIDGCDDRTDEQKNRFKRGLGCVNTWYTHPHATVLFYDVDMPGPDSSHSNLRPLLERGWSNFELRASSLAKHTNCLWSLRGFEDGGSCPEYGDALVHATIEVVRPVPVTPEHYAHALRKGAAAGELVFYGKADLEVVAAVYSRAFEEAFEEAKTIDFSHLGWADAQMKDLALVLARAMELGGLSQCDKIDVGHNPCSKVGLRALAEALKGTKCQLWAEKTGASKAGHDVVQKALEDTGVTVVLESDDF